MINSGIRPAMTMMGPVRVRLAGVVHGDADGHQSINSPKVTEAVAQLRQAARLKGADDVVAVSSDYRRAALAAGPLTTQWSIVVEAYGTAVSRGEAAQAAEAVSQTNETQPDA